MAHNKPIIRAHGVGHQYNGEWALQDVSLSLEPGESLAVMGPNGSGKTTLARILCQLLQPTTGSVETRGRVGAVFEDAESQIIGDTVWEDAALGPENLCLPPPEIRERVRWALEKTGLATLRDRRTATLSGGEKKRLAIAGALAMHPRVLVLDEPLSMLDPHAKRRVARTIHALEDVAIVWITHDLEVALQTSQALILKDGRPYWRGPSTDLPQVEDIERLAVVPPHVRVALRLAERGHPLHMGPEAIANLLEEVL